MYQLYHIGTDTKRAFQPLRNQLFLGACLTTWPTTTYGTFVGSVMLYDSRCQFGFKRLHAESENAAGGASPQKLRDVPLHTCASMCLDKQVDNRTVLLQPLD